MKNTLKKLLLLKHIFGLINILLYFIYIGINMHLNRGNQTINIILLILVSLYLIVYIYGAFIDNNRKVLRKSGKAFKRIRKFIGFVNSCLIVASLATNTKNSFITIFLAITSILFYVLYLIYDVTSSLAVHEIKKITNKRRNNHDYSN